MRLLDPRYTVVWEDEISEYTLRTRPWWFRIVKWNHNRTCEECHEQRVG